MTTRRKLSSPEDIVILKIQGHSLSSNHSGMIEVGNLHFEIIYIYMQNEKYTQIKRNLNNKSSSFLAGFFCHFETTAHYSFN